jgi:hypothetical protein
MSLYKPKIKTAKGNQILINNKRENGTINIA